jgi:ankyrin repeat protein
MNSLNRRPFWTDKNVLNIKRLAEEIASGSDVNYEVHPSNKIANVFPLGLAAYHGNLKACQMLLEARANPNRGDISTVSPLCKIIYGRREWFASEDDAKFSVDKMGALIALLIKHGASPDGMPKEVGNRAGYESPLYAAIRQSDYAAIALLAEFGADLEVQLEVANLPADGKPVKVLGTPLYYALEKDAKPGKPRIGDQKAMVALLRAGADDACLGSKDDTRTPFQESVIAGRDQVVKYYVMERGEDPAQHINGIPLAQLAGNDATRTVLNSLKTELAIQHALGGQANDARSVMESKKGKGMSPL